MNISVLIHYLVQEINVRSLESQIHASKNLPRLLFLDDVATNVTVFFQSVFEHLECMTVPKACFTCI